jgi:hypothetical protein
VGWGKGGGPRAVPGRSQGPRQGGGNDPPGGGGEGGGGGGGVGEGGVQLRARVTWGAHPSVLAGAQGHKATHSIRRIKTG